MGLVLNESPVVGLNINPDSLMATFFFIFIAVFFSLKKPSAFQQYKLLIIQYFICYSFIIISYKIRKPENIQNRKNKKVSKFKM